MSLQDAVEAPRLHVERDGKTSFEPEAAQSEFLALGEKAHAWPAQNLFFGGVHAARCHPKEGMEGAGDPRRQGQTRVA
jgi:gamma-glutamyltranspeptidase/glutathione hydrolase